MADKEISWLTSDHIDADQDVEVGGTSHAHHDSNVKNQIKTPPSSPPADNSKPSWLEETTPLNPNKVKQRTSERKTMKYKPGGNSRKSIMPLPAPASAVKQKVVTTTVSQEEDGCCCPVDPVLYWFRVFHFVSGLIAILALVSNASLFFIANLSWRAYVLHGYAAVLCLLIIAVELEIQLIIVKLKILDLWVFRGLFYSFVGFLSLEENPRLVAQNIIALVLVGFGLTYSIMGMLGMRTYEIKRLEIAKSTNNTYTEIVDDFSISPMK